MRQTTTKTISSRTKWILLAAIAAVPLAPLSVSAQLRSTQDGSALDANNRVGGTGRNDVGAGFRIDSRVSPIDIPTGNQIVTGNVTGNKQFRGPVGYRDANEFRGPTATDNSDNFIRQSSGSAEAALRRGEFNTSVPFYPGGRTV